MHRFRWLLVVGLVGSVLVACGAATTATVSSVPTDVSIVVVETRVVSVANGQPTVAIHLRAPRLVGGEALQMSSAAAWSNLDGTTDFPCGGPLGGQPIFLGAADAGVVFPMFAPDSESQAAAAATHDGWVTLQTKARHGCVATISLSAGYSQVPGLPSGAPSGVSVPPYTQDAVVATIQVRGDGTALDASPHPVITPTPAPPYWAENDRGVIADLSDLIGEWNLASTPVAAGLSGTNLDLAEWARRTKSDRAEMTRILYRMGKVEERIRNPDGIDAIGNIVVNYAEKLDAYDALAKAALAGDRYGVEAAIGELRIAVSQVPGLVKRFAAAYQAILTPAQQALFEGIGQ